jgi:GGDEF domain-containing protein
LTADLALQVADRIRDAYNKRGFGRTSLSIGIAQFLRKTEDIDSDIEDMVRRSDRALYHAKQNLGGNAAHFDEESAQF